MDKKGVIYCEKLDDGSFNLSFYDTKDKFLSETNAVDNFESVEVTYENWDIIKINF